MSGVAASNSYAHTVIFLIDPVAGGINFCKRHQIQCARTIDLGTVYRQKKRSSFLMLVLLYTTKIIDLSNQLAPVSIFYNLNVLGYKFTDFPLWRIQKCPRQMTKRSINLHEKQWYIKTLVVSCISLLHTTKESCWTCFLYFWYLRQWQS